MTGCVPHLPLPGFRQLRLGPTPSPLPEFRIHHNHSRDYLKDDSVVSNSRGLPQKLAAPKFIQLTFQSDQALACLRPSNYHIPAKAYDYTPYNDHTGVGPAIVFCAWRFQFSMFDFAPEGDPSTNLKLDNGLQPHHLSEVSLLSHSPQRLSTYLC